MEIQCLAQGGQEIGLVFSADIGVPVLDRGGENARAVEHVQRLADIGCLPTCGEHLAHPGGAGTMRTGDQNWSTGVGIKGQNERPEFTALKEGFFHLNEMQGTVETTSMTYLIRDHDKSKFEHKKTLMVEAGNYLNEKYGAGTIQIDLTDLYYNLREKIDPVYFIVDIAEKAMKLAGVQPKLTAVRGGTDGSRLSFMGLPTPNIFAGAHNFHSRYEFIPVESMEKAVVVIVKIAELFAEIPR